MDAYTSFAAVYDTFMDNIPYEEWKSYLKELLKEYGVQDGLVLDLGCGTGTMTELLAADGYDMIGVDNSEEMLEIAREKQIKSGHEILYLLQDMREFELYGTVGAVFSICDSLNYITEPEELKQVFRWVNNYLDPGGIFIFDFNTEYKYREVLGDQTIAEAREDCSFIWDNYYYEGERNAVFLGEKVTKYHRTMTTYINSLLENGFMLEHFVEPKPPKEMMNLKGMKDEMRRPIMFLISARKK